MPPRSTGLPAGCVLLEAPFSSDASFMCLSRKEKPAPEAGAGLMLSPEGEDYIDISLPV
jgi:hypothetical protein